MNDEARVSTLRRILRPTRAKVCWGVAIALVASGLVWWFDGGRWMFHPRHFGVIEDGVLYRSGQIHERIVGDVLDEYGIRVIVDLSGREELDADRAAERDAATRLGIRVVTLETLDGSGVGDLDDYVVALSEMIRSHQTGTPTLLHCSAGTQRTGAATAWYRMLVDGWSGPKAYAEYMRYRYDRPDSGRLAAYVNANMETLVDELVRAGALERRPPAIPHFGPE